MYRTVRLFGCLISGILCALPVHRALAGVVPPSATPPITVKVTAVHPRTPGMLGIPAGPSGQFFTFRIDYAATFGPGDCAGVANNATTATLFFIPKMSPTDPNVESVVYRELVATVMAAYSLGRPISLYWDTCMVVSGFPFLRVVAFDSW